MSAQLVCIWVQIMHGGKLEPRSHGFVHIICLTESHSCMMGGWTTLAQTENWRKVDKQFADSAATRQCLSASVFLVFFLHKLNHG